MKMGFQKPARREWQETAPERRPLLVPEKTPATPVKPVQPVSPVKTPEKQPVPA